MPKSQNILVNTDTQNDVHLILKDLLKVIKVVAMYPPDNPLPQSLKQSFAERLVDLIDARQGLTLRIEKENIFEGSAAVFEDRPPDEALASIFFNAGITQIKFAPGLNWDNVIALLEVFRRHQNREDNSGDLASAFWEANISGFSFRTVEDVALTNYDGQFKIQEFEADDGDDGDDRGHSGDGGGGALYESLFVGVDYETSDETRLYDDDTITGRRVEEAIVDSRQLDAGRGQSVPDASLFFGEETIDGEESATKAMGFEDIRPVAAPKFDTKRLIDDEYQPTSEELAQLAEMMNRDTVFDIYESTVELLKEMLHQEDNLSSFAETVTICEKLVTTFVRDGHIAIATDLLGYLYVFRDRIKSDKPQWATRLQESVTTLGSRERLEVLAESLNAHANITGEQVTAYLFGFDWKVIAGLSAVVSRLVHANHRQAMLDLMSQRGGDHLAIISRNLLDRQPEAVRNAVVVLGRIGTEDALQHLKKVVSHKDISIRQELVQALVDCTHDLALDLLVQLTRDQEAEIRAAAVAALSGRRGPKAFEAVSNIIINESFSRLTEQDQKALLTAYSVLGGDHAVDYLTELATRSNPLGDATLKFYREAAFVALAHNRSEKSERVLVKLAASWRPDLKRRAQDAIKERRELVYGEKHG